MRRFEAEIETARGGDAYIAVPADVVAALGGGRIPVCDSFGGVEYTGSIVSMSGGPCLGHAEGDSRAARQVPGDTLVVTTSRDTAERTVEVPDDLAAAWRRRWAGGLRCALLFATRQLVGAIESAERPETRARRIDEAVAAAG